MKQGTRLEAIVTDPAGVLALRAGAVSYRGTLPQGMSDVAVGQQIRLRVELEHLAGEPPSLDLTMTLVGRVSSPHDASVESPYIELIKDACFEIEVQQFTRGLLWEEPTPTLTSGFEAIPTLELPTLELPTLEPSPPALQPPPPDAPLPAPPWLSPEVSAVDTSQPPVADKGVADRDLVTVTITDTEGALALEGDGATLTGRLLRSPDTLRTGLELHLRMAAAGERSEAVEQIDVLGCVVRVEGADVGGEQPFRAGLRFTFAVTRTSGGRCPFALVDDERLQALVGSVDWDTAATDLSPRPDIFTPTGEDEAALGAPYDLPPLHGEEVPCLEPSGIIGSLRQMPLIDLLQSLEMNRKSCRVDIPGGSARDSGVLYLRRGQLVAAFCGDLTGESAFFALAEVEEGTFRVHFDREAPEQNIHHSTTFLILETMRKRDEAQGLIAVPEVEADTDEYDVEAAFDAATLTALDRAADAAAGQPSGPTRAALDRAATNPEPTPPALPLASDRVRPRTPVFAAFFEEARRAQPAARRLDVVGADFTPTFSVPVITVAELERALDDDGSLDALLVGWSDSTSTPPLPL